MGINILSFHLFYLSKLLTFAIGSFSVLDEITKFARSPLISVQQPSAALFTILAYWNESQVTFCDIHRQLFVRGHAYANVVSVRVG